MVVAVGMIRTLSPSIPNIIIWTPRPSQDRAPPGSWFADLVTAAAGNNALVDEDS